MAADEVIVSTPLGLIASNMPGYTLHFTRNGEAVLDGRLHGYDGHYVAKLDFVPVEAALERARLCEGNGIPLIVPAPQARYVTPHVLMHVRCAGVLKTYNDVVASQLPEVATQLLAMGKDFAWQRTSPAQRRTIVRFAH